MINDDSKISFLRPIDQYTNQMMMYRNNFVTPKGPPTNISRMKRALRAHVSYESGPLSINEQENQSSTENHIKQLQIIRFPQPNSGLNHKLKPLRRYQNTKSRDIIDQESSRRDIQSITPFLSADLQISSMKDSKYNIDYASEQEKYLGVILNSDRLNEKKFYLRTPARYSKSPQLKNYKMEHQKWRQQQLVKVYKEKSPDFSINRVLVYTKPKMEPSQSKGFKIKMLLWRPDICQNLS